MSQVGALIGAIRYEFAMQIRRPSLWIGLGLLAALIYFAGLRAVLDDPLRGKVLTHHDDILYWTWSSMGLFTVGAGLLLADRFQRDRRTRVDEVLRTATAPISSRFVGKYLGATLATLVPIAVFYFGGVVYIAARWGDFGALPFSLATFALMGVPPILFVGAFSVACTTVLWQPLYMFLYVGWWFWANLGSGTAIPMISSTYLAPEEPYVAQGIFHFGTYQFVTTNLRNVSALQGVLNIAVLLGCGVIALAAAVWLQKRRVAHE